MIKHTRKSKFARESRRAPLSAIRALGLYLAVFGAALIFATAIAAHPKEDLGGTRSGANVTAKEASSVRHTPTTRQSRTFGSEPLTLLDVRRLPQHPATKPKRKTSA